MTGAPQHRRNYVTLEYPRTRTQSARRRIPMGYDLSFWKYAAESAEDRSRDHYVVYEALSDGETVDDLEDMPVERIKSRIGEVMGNFTQVGDDAWEGSKGAFTLYTTRQYMRFNCYGLTRSDMNAIVDLMLEFGFPLYDPQVNERFG